MKPWDDRGDESSLDDISWYVRSGQSGASCSSAYYSVESLCMKADASMQLLDNGVDSYLI
jgi:hypothetical protein